MNAKEIREKLGITQEAMAMVLKITRPQWSMYESRRRRLPKEAQSKFDQLYMYAQNIQQEQFINDTVAVEMEFYNRIIKRLEKNTINTEAALRKIPEFQLKYSEHLQALKLWQFLDTAAQTETGQHFHSTIQYHAKKGLEYSQRQIVKLTARLKFLEQEAIYLNALIKENTRP